MIEVTFQLSVQNMRNKFEKLYDICQNSGLYSALVAAATYGYNRVKKRLRRSRLAVPGHIRYVKYKYEYAAAAPGQYDIIHLDPHSIEFAAAPSFGSELTIYGTFILDGNWNKNQQSEQWFSLRGSPSDRELYRFDNYAFYNSINNHFNNGVPWQDTDWFQWVERTGGQGQYSSMEKMEERLSFIDELYEKMKQFGYKAQTELNPHRGPCPEFHEVRINIGPDGEFIFDGGRHRLSVARTLNLSEIPVRVLVRHKKWQQIRTEFIEASCYSDLSARAKSYVTHPDMQSLDHQLGDITA